MPVRLPPSTAHPALRWSASSEVLGDPALIERIAVQFEHPRDVLSVASVTRAGRRASANLRSLRMLQADTATNFSAYEQARTAAEPRNYEWVDDWRSRDLHVVRRHAYDQPARVPNGVGRSFEAQNRRWLTGDLARLGFNSPKYRIRAAAFDGSAAGVRASMREVMDATTPGAPGVDNDVERGPLHAMTMSLAQLAQRDAITGKNIAAFLALREERKIVACETPAARLHLLLHAIRDRNMFATEFMLSVRKRFGETGSFLAFPVANPPGGVPDMNSYAFAIEHAAIASGSVSMARRITRIPGIDFNRSSLSGDRQRPIQIAIQARDIPLIAFFAELHADGHVINPQSLLRGAVVTHDAATLRAVLALPFVEPNLLQNVHGHFVPPIHHAVTRGNLEILRVLLADPRTNVDAADNRQANLVAAMASSRAADRDEMLELIAGLELNWSARDTNQQTPLHHAAIAGNIPFFRAAFSRAGVDPCALDNAGNTPFDLYLKDAALDRDHAGFKEVLAMYERLGPAGVNVTRNVAAMFSGGNNAENLRYVLERGYDINAHIPDRLQPAIYGAVNYDRHDMLEILLARPDLRTDIFRQHNPEKQAIGEFILDSHAGSYDPILNDPDEAEDAVAGPHFDDDFIEDTGKTFDMFVRSMHFHDEHSVLLHDMILTYENLHEAVRERFLPRFDSYLSRTDVDLSGLRDGATPLHDVVEYGDLELIKRLLGHMRIEPEKRNAQGLTAAELAITLDNPEIFRALAKHPFTPPPAIANAVPAAWLAFAAEHNAVACIGALCATDQEAIGAELSSAQAHEHPVYLAIDRRRHASLEAMCTNLPPEMLAECTRIDGYIARAIKADDAKAVEILLRWSDTVSQKHLAAALRPPFLYPDILTFAIERSQPKMIDALLANARIVGELRRSFEPARSVAAALASNDPAIMQKIFASPIFDPQMLMHDGRDFIEHIVTPLDREAIGMLTASGKIDRNHICRDGFTINEHLTNAELVWSADFDRRVQLEERLTNEMPELHFPDIVDLEDAAHHQYTRTSDVTVDDWVASVLR